MGWMLRNGSIADIILKTWWSWGAQDLFLKKWSVYFDAKSERLEITSI